MDQSRRAPEGQQGASASGFGNCPLCGAEATPIATVSSGSYARCPDCRLIFQHPAEGLDRVAERAYYELHENDPHDPGYRSFIDRLTGPLCERLEPGAEGLDYGCGPGPALSRMMEARGFRVADYDPIFAPRGRLLKQTWDFITCTETVEHFRHPGIEFRRLDRLLKPGGWLGVMTEPRDPGKSFSAWWYHRDPTHVCFYEPFTLKWIAGHFDWQVSFASRTVALFRKRRNCP